MESSCDETAVAIYASDRGLLAHRVYTQADLHEIWGGVVPELASRDHVRRVTPMIRQVLADAGLAVPPRAGPGPGPGGRGPGGAPRSPVDGVAYTAGPGLVGALLVGAAVARGLAYAWGVPAVGVHHLEGHLLAPLLEVDPPAFPYLALLVSGGHTMLVDVEGLGRYRVLGESLDDAAGEAFDKTAKLLGLAYPGGAKLARLAESGREGRFEFPRPMLDRPGLDFSFSGLKTAALVAIAGSERENGRPLDEQGRADLARGFELAVVDTLVAKTVRALDAGAGRYRSVVVAGGVGANRRLRERLAAAARARGVEVHSPRPEFCTDNAAMIAFAGHARLAAGETTDLRVLARARWPIEELAPPGATPSQ